jgi:hypothetical protein
MSQKQEIDVAWQSIVRGIDGIIDALAAVPEAQRNEKPVEAANSLYVLAVHVLGSTEKNLLDVLGGEPFDRDRPAEFVATGTDVEPLRRQWADLRARIEASLERLPDGALDQMCEHFNYGSISGREILIIVVRHVSEHLGHAELTRDLLLS